MGDVDTAEPTRSAHPWRGLALRIGGSAVMLGVLVWKAPDFDADELVPEWHLGHALVAARRRRPHPRSPSCCRRCAGRRCSPPSACAATSAA